MNQFSVVDDSFDISLTSSYYLSIRVSPDGFSFCVLDPIYNKFIQFKECRFHKPDSDWSQVVSRLSHEDLLTHPFKRKLLIVEDDFFALIPNALFKPEKALDLLLGTYELDVRGKQAIHNSVKMVDAVNLFLMSDNLQSFIKQSFPDLRVFHHVTPFIESTVRDDYRVADQAYVHIYFRKSAFDILVMSHRELLLANRFSFADENEIVYFILFVFEQLKLQPGKTEIHLSGDVEAQSARYLMLKSYLKTVQMAVLSPHFQFGEALLPVDVTRHHLLFNSFLCV